MVFAVIVAGSVVRMTQSGMGCPDWPTCFGRWIPPTSADQLPADYEKYLKQQDIDHSFNAAHTWTEYVNRLLGALLGVFLLIQFVWSLRFWKANRRIAGLCLATLILTGFQAWLGKRVVDANLASVKITVHMLVALLIAAMSFTIIYLVKSYKKATYPLLSRLTAVALLLLLVQIVLGTQVREQIDVVSKQMNYSHRESWIDKLNAVFYIHRSFSIVVGLLCGYLFFQFMKLRIAPISTWIIAFGVLLEIVLGLILAYFYMPAIVQPLHLFVSVVLFIALYNNWLKTSVNAS